MVSKSVIMHAWGNNGRCIISEFCNCRKERFAETSQRSETRARAACRLVVLMSASEHDASIAKGQGSERAPNSKGSG